MNMYDVWAICSILTWNIVLLSVIKEAVNGRGLLFRVHNIMSVLVTMAVVSIVFPMGLVITYFVESKK